MQNYDPARAANDGGRDPFKNDYSDPIPLNDPGNNDDGKAITPSPSINLDLLKLCLTKYWDAEFISLSINIGTYALLLIDIDIVKTKIDLGIFSSKWIPHPQDKSNLPIYHPWKELGPDKPKGEYRRWGQNGGGKDQLITPVVGVTYGRGMMIGNDFQKRGAKAYEGVTRHTGSSGWVPDFILSPGFEALIGYNEVTGEQNDISGYALLVGLGIIPIDIHDYLTYSTEMVIVPKPTSEIVWWGLRLIFK